MRLSAAFAGVAKAGTTQDMHEGMHEGKSKGGRGKGSLYEMEAGAESEIVMKIEQTNRAKRGSRAYVPKSNNLPSKARDEVPFFSNHSSLAFFSNHSSVSFFSNPSSPPLFLKF